MCIHTLQYMLHCRVKQNKWPWCLDIWPWCPMILANQGQNGCAIKKVKP